MKNIARYIKVVIVVCVLSLAPVGLYADQFTLSGTVDVYFSPRGGCTDAIVNELNSAKAEILVQAYSFTSAPITQAMIDANGRGVRVIIVLDKGQKTEKYSPIDQIVKAGIPVLIDSKHAIAHNKIMIIDRSELITGSFNFTKSAEEKNAENLLILKGDKELIDRYVKNFEDHKGHSVGVYRAH